MLKDLVQLMTGLRNSSQQVSLQDMLGLASVLVSKTHSIVMNKSSPLEAMDLPVAR